MACQTLTSTQIIFKCDWIWENPASTHNYKYLEIPILIIWSIATWEGNRYLHKICHDSIAIYNLSIQQLLSEQLAELPTILDSFLLV